MCSVHQQHVKQRILNSRTMTNSNEWAMLYVLRKFCKKFQKKVLFKIHQNRYLNPHQGTPGLLKVRNILTRS